MNHSPDDSDSTLVFRRNDFDDGQRGRFPEDLRSWMPAVRLVRLVEEVASSLPGAAVPSADARRLAAILMWCLATGRYGSWDIEAVCAEEPLARHLAGELSLSHMDIHRFRREHQEALTDALVRLLNAARPDTVTASAKEIAIEAIRRYERARYADAMGPD